MIYSIYRSAINFVENGGPVLWVIFLISSVLIGLLIDRVCFLRFGFPTLRQRIILEWCGRSDRRADRARWVRDYYFSQANLHLRQDLTLIKGLVLITPLCGLLGTITGMIEVFSVMSLMGSGDPRAMASGISQATIPTMAAMLIAVLGLIASSRIESAIKRANAELFQALRIE